MDQAVKSAVKRFIPRAVLARRHRWKMARRMRREFAADLRRYAQVAALEDGDAHAGLSGRNLEAQLTKDYHRVEKGLALPDPRRPFGDAVASRIDLLLPSAAAGASYADHAATARTALADWNGGAVIDDTVSPIRVATERGVGDLDQLFATRHSVRDFAATHVPDELLDQAVTLAIHTPSVCNRQPWHVRFYRGGDVDRVRRFQNGNAGFGEIPVLAVITADARMFAGAGERNQGWIDGGLFAMSLVWALHGLGLDACMLNMSVSNDVTDGLRAETGIPGHELVVMMVAIGYGRDGHRRARSPRRRLREVRLA